MNPLVRWSHQLGSPPYFDRFAARWAPWCFGLGVLVMLWGGWQGLFVVPADHQQGDSFRILYIHVPSAWMSMFIFGLMVFYSAIALIWRIKLCEILAMACAPIGAAFTVVTLATGSMWGKPMWGTWWYSLHQGQAIRMFGESNMGASMIPPLPGIRFIRTNRIKIGACSSSMHEKFRLRQRTALPVTQIDSRHRHLVQPPYAHRFLRTKHITVRLYPMTSDEGMATGRHTGTFSVRSTLRRNSNNCLKPFPGANA